MMQPRRFYRAVSVLAVMAILCTLVAILMIVRSITAKADELSIPMQHVVAVGERNGHPIAKVRNGVIQVEGDICNLTNDPVTALVSLQWGRFDPRGQGFPLFTTHQTYVPNVCERHALICDPAAQVICARPFVNEVPIEALADSESLWQIAGEAHPIDGVGRSVPITTEPFYLEAN